MPSQLCQLKSLQKLTNYRVGKKSGTRVGELRELSHIGGILRIKELQNVVDGRDASETNLVGKQYLNDLRLEWNDDDGVDQNGADIVLNNLQPHSNLKRLTIQGYGGLRFPDWLGGPAMLMINMVVPTSLALNGCVWEAKVGEFPRLKELYIHYCPKLTGNLPDHLPLLTKLEITECKRLVAPLPRVSAIRELTTRNNGRVSLMSPASDFICLESLITSDISQWTKLPPALQKLSIEKADSLELDILDSTCNSLCFPLSIFPRLTSLRIYKVRGLESLSFSISEGDPTSFKYLSVSGCPDLVSIELPALNFSLFFIVDCWRESQVAVAQSSMLSVINIGDCPEIPDGVGSTRSDVLFDISTLKVNVKTWSYSQRMPAALHPYLSQNLTSSKSQVSGQLAPYGSHSAHYDRWPTFVMKAFYMFREAGAPRSPMFPRVETPEILII
ncbi:putative disease resistance protein [Vitis vinifera]|uniref:Putative disease resistance protein n=1 Tax=Vitis vinifera TaxID=29760 RepID=A0A438H980_VITVI|nr:putative disease resistance protein [Vitis vinifera]